MTMALFDIAWHEFRRVLLHPLVLIVGLIVLAVAYLNGAGYADTLRLIGSMYDVYRADAFIVGVSHLCASTSMASVIVAAFLSATSIPGDRWKNALNVLLTKPLYRKDYLLGKFLGLSAFMLLFNAFVFSCISLMILVYYGGPLSIMDGTLKVISYLLTLTLACVLVIAFNLLFGVLSKNVLFVTTATMTFIFVDRLWLSENFLGGLSILLPTRLYYRILDPTPYVPETPLPLDVWVQYAMPYIALLLVEIVVLLLAEIHIFSRDENV
ncbi:hypothetical protein Mtc_0730 [Methanocella conradii HZ254]|uniref:ABC-type transport system involved in multi-copper enzyme maturation, permease component n=2 Tax=Methanocella TaxID=570266 RepID=H8I8L8_METCZ|nr:hypothetical protein Mtc_0730 [Methanocella conradii HZ254]